MSEVKAAPKRSPQTVRGVVVSDKMDKTRVIQVTRQVKHKLYHKQISLRSKLKIHDEKNESKTGDLVDAAATRPLSKYKHFRLLKVVERSALDL